jgi:hypothetical protein
LESLCVISGVGGGTSEGHRREGGELNGSSAMIGTSSRAAIACLRALTNETRRVERKLRSGGLNDGQSEELGHYMTDLGEALAWVEAVYESHRARDKTLTPVNELLDYFRRNEQI